jgi:hypothetical protein
VVAVAPGDAADDDGAADERAKGDDGRGWGPGRDDDGGPAAATVNSDALVEFITGLARGGAGDLAAAAQVVDPHSGVIFALVFTLQRRSRGAGIDVRVDVGERARTEAKYGQKGNRCNHFQKSVVKRVKD